MADGPVGGGGRQSRCGQGGFETPVWVRDCGRWGYGGVRERRPRGKKSSGGRMWLPTISSRDENDFQSTKRFPKKQ